MLAIFGLRTLRPSGAQRLGVVVCMTHIPLLWGSAASCSLNDAHVALLGLCGWVFV